MALTFIFLLMSGLFMLIVTSAPVLARSQPSVPQFSVNLIDTSYDQPSGFTTTYDPYTGEKTTTERPGYRVNRFDIEVTIKNQPFAPYINEKGYKINLYYQIKIKPHFSEDWADFDYYIKSNSADTVVVLFNKYAVGSQLDIKVNAVAGYIDNPYGGPDVYLWCCNMERYLVADMESAYSSIQTITTTDITSTSSQSSTSFNEDSQSQLLDQIQPQNSISKRSIIILIAGTLFGGIIISGILIFFKRQTNKSSTYNTKTLQTNL